jgi:hypothetical protein
MHTYGRLTDVHDAENPLDVTDSSDKNITVMKPDVDVKLRVIEYVPLN